MQKKKKKGEGGGRLRLKRRYTEMEKLNRFRFFLPPSPPFFKIILEIFLPGYKYLDREGMK